MAHQFHHSWQVDTFHHQVAGEGMAKGVESGQAFNTSLLTDLDQLLSELSSQLATVIRAENVVAPVPCIIVLP